VGAGSYTVAEAVKDYLAEIAAEKKSAVRGAQYIFDASILPDLGAIRVEKLTTDRLNHGATSSPRRPSESARSSPRTRTGRSFPVQSPLRIDELA
jgi:hypothetical protein